MTDLECINTACEHTTSAEALNTFHACRPNHPLGRDNPNKWGNAHFVASGILHMPSDVLTHMMRNAVKEITR